VQNANTFEKIAFIEEHQTTDEETGETITTETTTYYYVVYKEDGTTEFYTNEATPKKLPVTEADKELLKKLSAEFPWRRSSPASYDRVTLGIVDTYSKSFDEVTKETILIK
jgi:hypothetical protein